MTKIYVLLISFLMTFCVCAAQFKTDKQFQAGNQYIVLDTPAKNNVPDVLEFFSINCPHCYVFDQQYHISDTLEKNLPKGVKLARYHVSFLGPLGKELTRAWAVAVKLNAEKKVLPLFFKAAQETQTLSTQEDIRQIFIQAGVTQEEYDGAWNSIPVSALVDKQERTVSDLKLQGVPAVVVKGKYMIKNENIDASSKEAYAKEYAQIVDFLLKK